MNPYRIAAPVPPAPVVPMSLHELVKYQSRLECRAQGVTGGVSLICLGLIPMHDAGFWARFFLIWLPIAFGSALLVPSAIERVAPLPARAIAVCPRHARRRWWLESRPRVLGRLIDLLEADR